MVVNMIFTARRHSWIMIGCRAEDAMIAHRTNDGLPRAALFAAAVAATFVLLLLLVGKPIPIIIWDEGRIIISAMEMRHSGIGLVATYEHHQDLWNTKPPLLIWLMTGSMALLGPTGFALRLPSLLSSLGTILLVMLFLRWITHSIAIAAFGGVALAASIGFFGEHGARTGDYDALLCFFTTSYLMIAFFALHREDPPLRWLLLAGAMAAGALMTKGIAGGVPAAGMLLHIVVTRRWRRLFATPRYLIAALLAVAPILLFLLLREKEAPGYLHAMIYNDVTGRFGEALDDHSGPPWYYLYATFVVGLFSLGSAALLAPLALPIARGRTRLALTFASCIALGQLVVVTMSSTKLTHYYLSAYPFVAIAAALAVHAMIVRLRRSVAAEASSERTLWIASLAPALLLVLGLAHSIAVREIVLDPRDHYSRTRYGALLDGLAGLRAPVLLIDRGWKIPDDPHYAPELRFYAMVAQEAGRRIDQTGDVGRIASAPPGTILATCDPALAPLLRDHAAALVLERDGCVARRQDAAALRAVAG